jgi:ABC-type Zn uptake system ZnuABC Zn-binding protein ZnuA
MRTTRYARVLALSAAVTLLSAAGASADGALRIVTTTPDLAAIAKAVGGGAVTAQSIAVGYQNAHFVAGKPSYMMKARRADLFMRVGLDLEVAWERLVVDGSRNPRIRPGTEGYLDCSEGITPLEVPARQKMSELRAMGDVHPAGNPHYWLDPYNARIMARTIAQRLGELRPADAGRFRKGADAFVQEIDERMFGKALLAKLNVENLWALSRAGKLAMFLEKAKRSGDLGGWAARMAPHRGKRIVTYHKAWSYFTERFGLVVAGEMEPKPGIPPSPSHVARITRLVQDRHVAVILLQPFYSRRAPDLVASRTDARVVVCPGSVGGVEGVDDYFALIDTIVSSLDKAFQGAATPAASDG